MHQPFECFKPRPVGFGTSQPLRTAASSDPARHTVRDQIREELIDQRGLAGPRLAADADDLSLSPGDGIERRAQIGQFRSRPTV